MDPITITALVVAIIGALGGVLAHLRIRSSCGLGTCTTSPKSSIVINEEFIEDLGKISESES